MKGYNLHDSELNEIIVNGAVERTYKKFIKIMKHRNKPLDFESVFLAGYMLSNPNVREKLDSYDEKEIKRNMHFN